MKLWEMTMSKYYTDKELDIKLQDTSMYDFLEKKVKKLTIDAIAKDKNSKVEIIDNNDLDKNNSVVLIKVTDKNGFSNYYKLKIDNSGNKKIMLFGIDILYIFIVYDFYFY